MISNLSLTKIKQFFTQRNTWTVQSLAGLVALFLSVFTNWAFLQHAKQVYYPQNIGFIIALMVILFALNYLLVSLISTRYTVKWLGALILVLSAVVAYHMDTFDVVIDKVMLQNVAETQTREVRDLVTFKFAGYVLLLGVLPAWWLLRQKVERTGLMRGVWSKLKGIGIGLLVIGLMVGIFNKDMASFVREHKAVRFYTNPLTYLYSAGQFIASRFADHTTHVAAIGADAKVPANDKEFDLVILLVGETARADHWSLNGYPKLTNPLLSKEPNLVSFTNISSCGTSTAVSVPCMFTNFGRDGYSQKKFNSTENALDVLKRAGVEVLWRDNNSSSKGVADRVTYQDYQTSKLNTVCDAEECRDEGMLVGLQEYINTHPKKDILIVLHTMGSHGPAYYKRYPKQFEHFTPTCQDNQLEKCSQDSISNAFDNTIVYSDYVITKTIELLKANQDKYETSMIYMSDHGESLGENGVYLHGMPYAIAPKAQKNPATAIWVGKGFHGVTVDKLKPFANEALSHDNLFHTLLGSFEVQSEVYKPQLDIFHMAGGHGS